MYNFHSFDQRFLLKRNMTEVKSYSMVSCGIKWISTLYFVVSDVEKFIYSVGIAR